MFAPNMFEDIIHNHRAGETPRLAAGHLTTEFSGEARRKFNKYRINSDYDI
jgi:hypothetical protein